MTSAPAANAPRRSRAPLAITAAIIAGLVVLFFVFAGLYTDVLWFDQLGFLSVLTTQWLAGGVLFLVGFIAMALPVWASIQLAYRLRPVYAKLNSQLDRYQQVIEPLRRLAMFGIPALLGLFAGVAAATRWQVVLMWLNRTVRARSTRSSTSTSRSTSSTCRSTTPCSGSPRPSCSSPASSPSPRATSTVPSGSAAAPSWSPRRHASRSPSPRACTCCCSPRASGSTSTRP